MVDDALGFHVVADGVGVARGRRGRFADGDRRRPHVPHPEHRRARTGPHRPPGPRPDGGSGPRPARGSGGVPRDPRRGARRGGQARDADDAHVHAEAPLVGDRRPRRSYAALSPVRRGGRSPPPDRRSHARRLAAPRRDDHRRRGRRERVSEHPHPRARIARVGPGRHALPRDRRRGRPAPVQRRAERAAHGRPAPRAPPEDEPGDGPGRAHLGRERPRRQRQRHRGHALVRPEGEGQRPRRIVDRRADRGRRGAAAVSAPRLPRARGGPLRRDEQAGPRGDRPRAARGDRERTRTSSSPGACRCSGAGAR